MSNTRSIKTNYITITNIIILYLKRGASKMHLLNIFIKYIYFSIKILFAIFFALSTVNSSGLNLNTQLKAIPLK